MRVCCVCCVCCVCVYVCVCGRVDVCCNQKCVCCDCGDDEPKWSLSVVVIKFVFPRRMSVPQQPIPEYSARTEMEDHDNKMWMSDINKLFARTDGGICFLLSGRFTTLVPTPPPDLDPKKADSTPHDSLRLCEEESSALPSHRVSFLWEKSDADSPDRSARNLCPRGTRPRRRARRGGSRSA